MKRRRDTNSIQNANPEDDDFTKSTGRSKKRAATAQKKPADMEPVCYNQGIDDDLDFYDCDGRVLPSWSTAGNGIQS
jgi:bloom syndrome protein